MLNHAERASGANNPGLPAVLTQNEWNELHDALELALDALGDGPQDVDYSYLVNAMIHQRLALTLTHRKARALGRHC